MASFSNLEKIAITILAIISVILVKLLVKFLYIYVIGPVVNKVDFKSKGKWALITGCTDGIGKEYARQLAARGCDIVLVSRSMDKLKATAEELEKDFKVNTKIVQADFAEGDEIYEHISRGISDLEIGTLVNNVGVAHPYPEYFLDLPNWDQLMKTIVRANVVAVTKMTGMILPGMVKRGKGVVINIGSAASIIPSPLLTTYAASKAFVDKFSEGLEMEYGKLGIIVQVVLPGFVCSNMSGIRRSSLFAPTAKSFVKSALSSLGTASRTTGYLPHTIFVKVLNAIHYATGSFGVWIVTRSMENNRRKAMKKYKIQ